METKNTEKVKCIECGNEFKRRIKGARASRLQPSTMGANRKTCSRVCGIKYRNRPQTKRVKMNKLNSPKL